MIFQKKAGADITWIRTGGIVDVFEPSSVQELELFLKGGNDFVVLGFGSNVILPDNDLDKVVLRLINLKHELHIEDGILIVGAGVPNTICTKFCLENEYSNLEFLCTIPGTIGGAIYMNAGAYGFSTFDFVKWIEAYDFQGNLHRLYKEEIKFEYRNSNLKNLVFIRACFELKKDQFEKIKSTMQSMKMYRNSKQPRFSTFGSTFKNTTCNKAWQLIYESGCAGLRCGGAYLSDLHLNFIINDGSATSTDVVTLISKIQQKVFQTKGIWLEREVIIL
ncbi:MAG: UDP-N-acetylmuramate dehydrogenase [Alphaproteobacteria bacterium]|nr:MAG: UDP-N-acetylmuramate dehydrogenase [Alphaproteobacteria bacterium]